MAWCAYARLPESGKEGIPRVCICERVSWLCWRKMALLAVVIHARIALRSSCGIWLGQSPRSRAAKSWLSRSHRALWRFDGAARIWIRPVFQKDPVCLLQGIRREALEMTEDSSERRALLETTVWRVDARTQSIGCGLRVLSSRAAWLQQDWKPVSSRSWEKPSCMSSI